MRTVITNEIRIENPSKEILDWCEFNLTLNNPEYAQFMRMGKEDLIKYKRVPEKIKLYYKDGNVLGVPYGCLYALLPWIKQGSDKIYCHFNKAPKISFKDAKASGIDEFYDYQEEAINAAIEAKGGVIVANCGAGKGLPLDAKIYTPTGWKRNGDLAVGDKIIGANGKATEVTAIYDKGLVDAYKVIFSDKTEIVCDKDHLWAVQTCSERNRKVEEFKPMRTEDMFKLDLKNRYRTQNGLFIPIVKPVEFEHQDVPIDPWFLGLLLADGCFIEHAIHVSIAEQDLKERVNQIAHLKHIGKYDYLVKDNAKTLFAIRELGLGHKHSYEKFIPDVYKYNDIETRLNLLRGILDGDGSVDPQKASIEFTTTSKQLAFDVAEIVHSLGGTTKTVERVTKFTYKGVKKEGRKSYRVHIKMYDLIPFSSEKNLSRYRNRTKYNRAYRKIVDVQKVEPIISRCITVSAPDHLYVTDNFVVTHNTYMGMELIKRIGKRALWLCHTGDLLRQAKDDLLKLYPMAKIGLTTEGKLEIGEDVTISTVQTMCKIDPDLYKDKFEVIICDEAAHVCGSPTKLKMFSTVLSKIPAQYKYGLTATPTRADGLIKAMYAYLGLAPNGAFAPTYKVDRSRVNTMEAEHIRVDVSNAYLSYNMWKIYDSSGMLDYNKLVSELCSNESRNQVIVDNVVKLAKEGRKQIVLSLRVEHCEHLVEMLQNRGIKALLCVGKITAKKREAILKQQVEWDVIVATYSLLKEGVSIKELDTLHLCSPAKEKGLIVQCAGRIERYLEGKKQPQIYDYVDVDIPYCENAYKKRKSALKRRF